MLVLSISSLKYVLIGLICWYQFNAINCSCIVVAFLLLILTVIFLVRTRQIMHSSHCIRSPYHIRNKIQIKRVWANGCSANLSLDNMMLCCNLLFCLLLQIVAENCVEKKHLKK